MGFVVGTAITNDTDLLTYVYEQQITNLIRLPNVTTFATLHVGATNTLIAEFLRPRGFNTAAKLAAIANTDDFKPALAYWVASRIFAGQMSPKPAERDAAAGKASYYADLFRKSLEKVSIDPGDSTTIPQHRLPVLVNVDGGSMFPALGTHGGRGGLGRPANVGATTLPNYDNLMIEGK